MLLTERHSLESKIQSFNEIIDNYRAMFALVFALEDDDEDENGENGDDAKKKKKENDTGDDDDDDSRSLRISSDDSTLYWRGQPIHPKMLSRCSSCL